MLCAVDERLSEVAGALGRAGIATQWGANALLVYGGRVIVRRCDACHAGEHHLLYCAPNVATSQICRCSSVDCRAAYVLSSAQVQSKFHTLPAYDACLSPGLFSG